MKHKTDNWYISEYNFDEVYLGSLNIPEKVKIHDSTLRDGEQTPGVVLNINEKIDLAKRLNEIGVDRIEAGMPAVSEMDFNAIKEISKLDLDADIFAFSRTLEEDIDLAVDCGVDGVIVEIPAGGPKLKHQFPDWTKEDVIERSVKIINYAKSKKLKTVYFGYDTTRTEWEHLENLYSTIIKSSNPDSIGIVDTMGCITPNALKNFVNKIRNVVGDIPLEIHGHNDLGMATAVSLAAVEAGVEVIHVCINGLGERTGNASLEEVAVGLNAFFGKKENFRFEKLSSLSKLTAQYTGITPSVQKPLVGENTFVRESGLGVDLVIEKPLAMFAINPEFVGNKPGIVLGKKSGLRSINYKIKDLGLEDLDKNSKKAILNEVKKKGIDSERLITDSEFINIYNKWFDKKTSN